MQDLWCPGRRGHPRRSQHTKAGPEGKSKEYGGQVRPLAQAKGLAYAPSSTPIRSSRSDKIQTPVWAQVPWILSLFHQPMVHATSKYFTTLKRLKSQFNDVLHQETTGQGLLIPWMYGCPCDRGQPTTKEEEAPPVGRRL